MPAGARTDPKAHCDTDDAAFTGPFLGNLCLLIWWRYSAWRGTRLERVEGAEEEVAVTSGPGDTDERSRTATTGSWDRTSLMPKKLPGESRSSARLNGQLGRGDFSGIAGDAADTECTI
ncbi:hypothetical protein GWI33_003568 [Rhynchophorus ferrugineus]|uniref:Uncharacterized protein n=1 Tax=Rhynchophorus ferrugineus TaxID=354439 RepID=A0A834HRE9_RHYFE|nr:hypothetical protein GWI33_003568 [Rhynchophorus ferrugineus]